jgi:uncharacterized protein (UPF0335 family)
MALAESVNDNVGGIAAAELRQFIERIERLEEEKKGLQDDIKDVFAEMKGRGYEPKIVKKILQLRKKDANERQEEESLLEVYMSALGMA